MHAVLKPCSARPKAARSPAPPHHRRLHQVQVTYQVAALLLQRDFEAAFAYARQLK